MDTDNDMGIDGGRGDDRAGWRWTKGKNKWEQL